MNALRCHLTARVVEKQTLNQIDLAYQFKKMVFLRFFAGNLLVFLTQYIGLKMSTLDSFFTPLWIAAGTANALLFLRGSRILPGIWLGSAFAYYFANTGLLLALTSASLLTLQPYILRQLCYRFASPTLIFYQSKLFLLFLLFATLLTAIISLLLTMLFYSHIQNHFSWINVWLSWWLGNLTGLIIFACAIVTWDAFFPQTYQLKNQVVTLTIFFAPFILLCFTFLMTYQILAAPLAILLLLLTLAISLRFKWCGLIAALFIQGLVFNIAFFCYPPISFSLQSTIFLQLFILLEIVLGFFVAILAKNWDNTDSD